MPATNIYGVYCLEQTCQVTEKVFGMNLLSEWLRSVSGWFWRDSFCVCNRNRLCNHPSGLSRCMSLFLQRPTSSAVRAVSLDSCAQRHDCLARFQQLLQDLTQVPCMLHMSFCLPARHVARKIRVNTYSSTLLCRQTCPCKRGAQTRQLVSVLILETQLAETQRQQIMEGLSICLACCSQERTLTGTPCGSGSSVLLQNLRKFNLPEPGDG